LIFCLLFDQAKSKRKRKKERRRNACVQTQASVSIPYRSWPSSKIASIFTALSQTNRLPKMDIMITAKDISKAYGPVKAIEDIRFHIRKGEIFGLLGPNGAGKSTTIHILSTLLRPDSGEVLFEGKPLYSDLRSVKMKIGVVPQEIALYESLSALENLHFWGGLYRLPRAKLRKKSAEVLEMMGLSDRARDPVAEYSGGMKRRVNIACALLHDPELLLMDEPTVGVDPQSRNHIFEVIEELHAAGKTIIYTTHYMEEAERLCERIAIIDRGHIAAIGTLEELRKISGITDILHIRMAPTQKTLLPKIAAHLKVLFVDEKNLEMEIECQDIGKDLPPIIASIEKAGGQIESVESKRANLEAIFLKLTGKALRD